MAQATVKKDQTVEEIKTDKVTQEELSTIQEYDKKLQGLQFSLGDLSIMKHNISKRNEFLTDEYDKLMTEKEEFVKTLNEKYGDVSIDRTSGNISETSEK
jgi:hypothetical protein